jgi:nucleoside-diphosphate-sugar epimerase/predicted dehydrogenase
MWKVGLLGTGYIAAHHKNALETAKQANIAAVCDLNSTKSQEFARIIPNCRAYSHLNEMLENEQLDVVHILTPPDQHYEQAKMILNKGISVFIEKPMCSTSLECHSLCELSHQHHALLGVNHNFLFFSAYLKLKKALADQQLGEVDHITITWHSNLEILKHGPYGGWMFHEPQNLWLETGCHISSMLLDLVDEYEIVWVDADKEMSLPNGKHIYRQWTVFGKAGKTTFEMRLSYTPGFEDKSIELCGFTGHAKVDFTRNTFLLKRHTSYSLPFDIYHMNKRESLSLLRQGYQNIQNYILSKLKLVPYGDPYAASIASSIHHFYDALGQKENNLRGKFGPRVIEFCEKALAKTRLNSNPAAHRPSQHQKSEILVLGGAGFIGQALTKELLKRGKKVRLLTRDPSKVESLKGDLDIINGDILSTEDLQQALKGIKTVYHLATAHVKTWKDYQEYDINATKKVGDASLEAGVERLIYTGTIDSYYAGKHGEIITEQTPLDPYIHRRNYYAQAKAAGEQYLKALHQDKNLPLVILRPGIVIGTGGSPFHWGVGMWHYNSVCQYWGKGAHPLPFVLVDDVVSGLILSMEKPNIEGQSFNLIDAPLLSAQDYIHSLEETLHAKIEAIPTSLTSFYTLDCFKYGVKVLVGHKDRRLPSWRDWSSRTQRATYDCTKAREQLGWRPASNKAHLIERGIRIPALYWSS